MYIFKSFWRALALCLPLMVIVGGCVTGGDVVRVTTVDGKTLDSLSQTELTSLARIKQRERGGENEAPIGQLIDAKPHFIAADYLKARARAKPDTGGNDYTVGAGDVLNVLVHEEPNLSRRDLRISGRGDISFPLIGRLAVEGLTTAEIEERIARQLAEEQFLLDANVSVMVGQYNSKRFLVLGSVRSPGSYALQARERVLDGISRAGGIDSSRAGSHAMIIRTEADEKQRQQKIVIDIDLKKLLTGQDPVANLALESEDMLFVPKAEIVSIIGQVKKPGTYPLNGNALTLVEAISRAGGFTAIAARNRTRIIRVEDGIEKIIMVKVDAITDAGKKIQDVVVRANDVIVVPESFF